MIDRDREIHRISLNNMFDRVSGNTVIMPMDDSSIGGPEYGLRDIEPLINLAREQRVDSVLAFPGFFKRYSRRLGNIAGILNITLSTEGPNHLDKRLVSDIEIAKDLGVEAVSVHVNMTSPGEGHQLENLGRIATAGIRSGVPILAHVYPRRIHPETGEEDHYMGLREEDPDEYAKMVRHGARIAADAGVDVIKVPYTGSTKSFKTVVDSTYGLPVVMAGGPKTEEVMDCLHIAEHGMEAGARGVAYGRNVWQRDHQDAKHVLQSLHRIVHLGESADTAAGNVAVENFLESQSSKAFLAAQPDVISAMPPDVALQAVMLHSIPPADKDDMSNGAKRIPAKVTRARQNHETVVYTRDPDGNYWTFPNKEVIYE